MRRTPKHLIPKRSGQQQLLDERKAATIRVYVVPVGGGRWFRIIPSK